MFAGTLTIPTDIAILRFAAFYGFDANYLTGSDSYRIESAGPDFDGMIRCIRITENGRFGNIVYQIMNAVLLGNVIGCNEIELFPFAAGPSEGIEAGGFSFKFRPADSACADRPTLVGHFFNSYPLGTALRVLDGARAWVVLNPVLAGLFHHIIEPAGAAATWRPSGSQLIVAHFRAGDIFASNYDENLGRKWWGGVVNPWYVQPPASYYVAAIQAALASSAFSEVRLVFEDRSNPSIDVVECQLRERGIPVVCQSADLATDLITLVSADHLVASTSTLVEIAALLSPVLKSYCAFRQFESHAHVHLRHKSLFGTMLASRNVQLRLFMDRGDYIPPLRWDASPEQLDLLCSYPSDRLVQLEGKASLDADARISEETLSRLLIRTEGEAIGLRSRLMSARTMVVALTDRLQAAETQLQTAEINNLQLYRNLDTTIGRLRAIENSSTWRLTGPLRRAAALLKRSS